ncbi:hypothetical protein Ancab_032068 [Ancistrocladus abbreviatus]
MAGAAPVFSLISCHRPVSNNPKCFRTPKSTFSYSIYMRSGVKQKHRLSPIVNQIEKDQNHSTQSEEDQVNSSIGVKAALSMLNFYKREISPLMPRSCRYVPTCSEYSMIAYKKYGFVKGTILTAWRLCRCNPLGGSGFDPPRWFDEERPTQQ